MFRTAITSLTRQATKPQQIHRASTSIAAMALPKTQKAILQPDPQSTAVTMVTDHPVPTPKPSSNEHLVRVHTAAITNGELLWTKNFPFPKDPTVDPKILVPCNDVAGTIVTAPPSSPFEPGTEVYARSSYKRTGCSREYTILMTDEMAKRPQRLSWVESAVVPMSAETAWQALFIHAGLEAKAGKGAEGKRVFVTAASGGVGVWMVQLAKWAGAEVVGSCSAENVEWVEWLGADEVIDYTKTDIKQWAAESRNKVDLAVDCIGRKSLEDVWWAVKDGGTLISIFQPPEGVKPTGVEKNIKDLFFIMDSSGEQLRKMTELIETGFGTPALDSTFPVDRFQEAFNRLESGKTRGKVVLDFGSK